MKFVTKENEFQSQVYHNLVGGIPTPPKNMKVSWDDYIPNIWKNNPNVPNHQPGNESCSPRLFFLFFFPDSAWRSFWRVRDFPVGSFSMAGREFVRHLFCLAIEVSVIHIWGVPSSHAGTPIVGCL